MTTELEVQPAPVDDADSAVDGKRLLLLSEIFPPAKGGSGRWFAELYPRLKRHRVQMMVGQHPRQDDVDALLPVEVNRVNLSMEFRGVSRLSSLRRYRELSRHVGKYVWDHRIDEIHAARPLSEGLVARLVKLRRGTPYTCFVHGEDVSVAKTSRELSLVTRWVLRRDPPCRKFKLHPRHAAG